ncbi:MAG: DUF4143 domain-containing protein [Pseudonocardiaceae bacterium]
MYPPTPKKSSSPGSRHCALFPLVLGKPSSTATWLASSSTTSPSKATSSAGRRHWLTAYAAATATTTSYSTILDAATPGDADKPAKTTTIAYRDVLSQIWLLEPVPGWLPTRNLFTRLAQAPKHHLADPALAARLLGALFESLIALNLRVYAQANEATVHHLRTRNGDHEIDFIIERDDHKIVALEVELSSTVEDSDVIHLHWLRKHLGPDILDAAVITTGAYAYRRGDGIAVIPAALLAP